MRAIFLSFITVIILSACLNEPQLPPLTNDYTLGESMPLALLEEASLSHENIHIIFSKVRDEARCPETWQCLWEGEAEVELTLKRGEFTEKIRLKYNGGDCTSCGNEVKALGYKIKLEQLTPYPDEKFYAKKPLNFEDYKIIISIVNDESEMYS
ncbi:MAG: hypothetical protein AB8G11_07290 [Saprospiraceae bacterium]